MASVVAFVVTVELIALRVASVAWRSIDLPQVARSFLWVTRFA